MTDHSAPNLFGSARDKAELFRERYIILQQVGKMERSFKFTQCLIIIQRFLKLFSLRERVTKNLAYFKGDFYSGIYKLLLQSYISLLGTVLDVSYEYRSISG